MAELSTALRQLDAPATAPAAAATTSEGGQAQGQGEGQQGQQGGQGSFVPAADGTRVRFIGERVVRQPDGSCTFDFQSCIELRLRRASSASSSSGRSGGEADDAAPCAVLLDLAGGKSHFNLTVGEEQRVESAVRTTGGRQVYTLPLLPETSRGQSELGVLVVKRTESKATQLVWPPASTSPAQLFGVAASPGWELCALPQPDPTARRIEFLGDSDTAAFGNEAPASTMSLRGMLAMRIRYQNISNSWCHMLARMLGAEPSVVAWSGVGCHTNAVMCGEPVLQDYFLRAVARDDSEAARHTDFGAEAAWRPQLVVIVVGGNDLYGGKTPPSEEEFVERYVQLLRTVREKRPAPTVLLSVVYSLDTPGYNSSASAGRREGETATQHLSRYVSSAVARYVEQSGDGLAPVHSYLETAGCAPLVWPGDGGNLEHWGPPGHAKFAEGVCGIIEGMDALQSADGAPWRRVRPSAELTRWVEQPPCPGAVAQAHI